MDGRTRKYGLQTSPERTKVRTEPPPKHQPSQIHYHQQQQSQQQQQQQGRRVPIVYYLCKNRHLEHPHFIEVPLSSPEGLYLRDVIRRLSVLRGKKMAAMYSWSCKRSYKNGFVWHDLAEDDLIFPAQGNEYVLKGSELLDQSPIDRTHRAPSNTKIQNEKHPHQEAPLSCRTVDTCSSPSSMVVAVRDTKSYSPSSSPPSPLSSVHPPTTQEDDLSPATKQLASSEDLSPKLISRTPASPRMGSQSPVEYRVCQPCDAQDASTQTDDKRIRKTCEPNMCTLGVSTDDRPPDMEFNVSRGDRNLSLTEGCEIVREERSPPPTSMCPTSYEKTNTLEALIRDEVNKRNNLRIIEQEEIVLPTKTKLKATSAIMQLLTCGSISVKDHYNFGLVPNYRPMFMNMKIPSSAISNSSVSGVTDCMPGSHRTTGLNPAKKEYFSGSIVEAKNKEPLPVLKRSSSSSDNDRICKITDTRSDIDKVVDTIQSKFLPRTIKVASSRPSRTDKIEISEAGNSFAEVDSCKSTPLSSSKVAGRKIIDNSSVKGSSSRFESFKEEKGKVFKIDERLVSGARIVIESASICNVNDAKS